MVLVAKEEEDGAESAKSDLVGCSWEERENSPTDVSG